MSQNWTSFGTLLLRLSEVQMMRFCELNGSGEIAIAIGIILAKRKGGIFYSYLLDAALGISEWTIQSLVQKEVTRLKRRLGGELR